MYGTIDRFERNIVIIQLDNGNIVNIEKDKIPLQSKEGDVLKIDKCISIDYDETKRRKKHIEDIVEDLWK
ncbi:DUF3006 domain-containing protein [Clostridium sp. DJ247]|nr:DUF3006 domain-containing protein [Clostridium sp. DJ247]